jgi:hypothetical protein
MGTTTWSGPIKAGNVKEGPSVNVGYVVMAQTAAWTQSTTAADTGINIPAGSQILDFEVQVDTACDGATQNLSVGTSATSTELFTALALGTSANTTFFGTAGTVTDNAVWADVGTTDVSIFVDFSAGSAGTGFITVTYLQAIDLA